MGANTMKAYTNSRRTNENWIKKLKKEIKEYSKYSWFDRTIHDKCIEQCRKEIAALDQVNLAVTYGHEL